jgi:hypothetical protein
VSHYVGELVRVLADRSTGLLYVEKVSKLSKFGKAIETCWV